jgi:hypothetical protein
MNIYILFWSVLGVMTQMGATSATAPIKREVIRINAAEPNTPEAVQEDLSLFLRKVEVGEATAQEAKSLVSKLSPWLEMGSSRRSSPSDRRELVTDLLKPSNYSLLEKYFLGQLESRKGEEVSTAMVFLGRCLYSANSIQPIRTSLGRYKEALSDDDPNNDPDPSVVFSAAEALAYLGDNAGVDVLASVLSSDTAGTSLKVRAMRALTNVEAQVSLVKLLGKYLRSPDANLSYRAFEILGPRLQDQRELLEAAAEQLERLTQKIKQKQPLSYAERVLLGRVSLILSPAVRSSLIPEDDRSGIHRMTKDILVLGSEAEKAKISSLFADLAGDEDAEVIASMLNSASNKLRADAARSLARCTRTVRERFLSLLLRMLDANDTWEKNFALYALRTHMGEKAATYLPEEEFAKERERVKQHFQKG